MKRTFRYPRLASHAAARVIINDLVGKITQVEGSVQKLVPMVERGVPGFQWNTDLVEILRDLNSARNKLQALVGDPALGDNPE